MYLAFARRGALGAVFLLTASTGAACSTTSDDAAAVPTPPGSVTPSGFAFDAGGVLQAKPEQDVALGIWVPGADEDVSVFLDGPYADGSLSAGTVTSAGGRATVTLHTPSSMATFAVHAHTARGEDARLDVSVSATGFANVTVTAAYEGTRNVTDLAGSIFLGSTCAGLANDPLHDGSLLVFGKLGSPLMIASIPAGTPFAVSTRIAHYASGCVDVDPLVATVGRSIDTSIYDLPMALAQTNLDVTFQALTTNAATSGWSAILATGSSDVGNAFFSGSSDANALLDAMQAATPGGSSGPNAAQFHTARENQNWSAATTSWLSSHTPSMNARARGWISNGSAAAVGDLTAHLAPGPSPGLADFSLVNFANFNAKNAGFSANAAFGWVADPDDTVHLSGPVVLSPSALAAAVADQAAVTDVPGSSDVSSALATQIDCAGLASSLVGAGVCYSGCDANCTGALCGTALAAVWQSARGASTGASHSAMVDLAVSAKAVVGDAAQPVSFSGSWSANVRASSGSFSTGGTTTATIP